ncbi:protein E6-like [Quercus lobata]|uniref:Protein E6 n=1 Tax=Quercus lobata TaxID=97700 RepID=A0A7N2LQD8_QUELO|nr:protein E6 [Quercus lobata]XP_030972894.1 protein E6-like [Quercus lobata]
MAPSAKFISFLFILTLSFFVQIHARESQFFSKVTNVNNDAKETTTVDPNKEEFLTKHEQQPVFIPQTQNGYGLYGHESGQFPPTTTTPTPTTTTSLTNVNAAPYTTTPTTTTNNNAPFKTVFEDDESLNKYLNSNQNYNYNPNPNNNNNNNNQNNEFYYNNNAYHASQNGLRDSRLTQRGGYTTLANQNNYNNNNNGANSYNNAERQGMSDTRFLENGKYYYDLNLENNYNPNRYENSRGVDSRNWNNNNNNNRGYYGSNNNQNTFEYKNSMEGYQNEEEFQESQDEFVP